MSLKARLRRLSRWEPPHRSRILLAEPDGLVTLPDGRRVLPSHVADAERHRATFALFTDVRIG